MGLSEGREDFQVADIFNLRHKHLPLGPFSIQRHRVPTRCSKGLLWLPPCNAFTPIVLDWAQFSYEKYSA
ncbi:hypothetical protein KIM372_11670 [Bombiscardovia nodaiensis]|uniref:Uncharacterized protein n=1 Tax=Bombiscardovia nodaiensis TaxID=2932181 RepID=A0ABM8B8U9_9BIFI|nr:hypothetical protein KIM372_11670 [Bombiscardovia nodaiensis]